MDDSPFTVKDNRARKLSRGSSLSEDGENYRYKGNPNMNQRVALISQMESSFETLNGMHNPSAQGQKHKQEAWELLTDDLNYFRKRRKKLTVKQCKDLWADMQARAKTRHHQLARHRNLTGGGELKLAPLTQNQTKILSLIPDRSVGMAEDTCPGETKVADPVACNSQHMNLSLKIHSTPVIQQDKEPVSVGSRPFVNIITGTALHSAIKEAMSKNNGNVTMKRMGSTTIQEVPLSQKGPIFSKEEVSTFLGYPASKKNVMIPVILLEAPRRSIEKVSSASRISNTAQRVSDPPSIILREHASKRTYRTEDALKSSRAATPSTISLGSTDDEENVIPDRRSDSTYTRMSTQKLSKACQTGDIQKENLGLSSQKLSKACQTGEAEMKIRTLEKQNNLLIEIIHNLSAK